MHGWLPLDYFRYMVTCKSSKSRTSLDFWAMGEFGLGHKGHQLGIHMPLITLFQVIDPLTKNCLIFWLFVLRPSTPLARPRLHHFKLLLRLSCNFMRFFVKTLENWWSKINYNVHYHCLAKTFCIELLAFDILFFWG